MIRNSFWFLSGVASTFASCMVIVSYVNKNHPEAADKMVADVRNV